MKLMDATAGAPRFPAPATGQSVSSPYKPPALAPNDGTSDQGNSSRCTLDTTQLPNATSQDTTTGSLARAKAIQDACWSGLTDEQTTITVAKEDNNSSKGNPLRAVLLPRKRPFTAVAQEHNTDGPSTKPLNSDHDGKTMLSRAYRPRKSVASTADKKPLSTMLPPESDSAAKSLLVEASRQQPPRTTKKAPTKAASEALSYNRPDSEQRPPQKRTTRAATIKTNAGKPVKPGVTKGPNAGAKTGGPGKRTRGDPRPEMAAKKVSSEADVVEESEEEETDNLMERFGAH